MLPEKTRTPSAQLQKRLRGIIGCQNASFSRVEGGYTPTSRWVVSADNGRFFAKVATTPLTAVLLRREARAYEVVHGRFMPAFIGWEDHEHHPLLVIEDLSRVYWPPPWSRKHIENVLQQIENLHQTNALLPTYQQMHSAREQNWAQIAENPEAFLSLGMASEVWLKHALPILLAAESGCETAGQAVTHWDIRSDNLCITANGVKFFDWAEACLSNPKLDLGFWLPSLAFEGGPKPEEIMPAEPEVAAWVAGFFAARAGLPIIPDAPNVRVVQRQQLETALPWAVRALGLPHPGG